MLQNFHFLVLVLFSTILIGSVPANAQVTAGGANNGVGASSAAGGGGASGIGLSVGGNGVDFSILGDFQTARYDYWRLLIADKLADSQIQLNRAVASLNTALANHYRELTRALRFELNRVISEQANIDNTILDIQIKARLANRLKMGEANKGTWVGLDLLMRNYIPVFILKDAMSMPVGELALDNFTANDGRAELRGFKGGNMGQFLTFLKKRDYSTVPWSDAHFALLEMMTRITSSIDEKIALLHKYMDQIRAGTLNVWSAPVIY